MKLFFKKEKLLKASPKQTANNPPPYKPKSPPFPPKPQPTSSPFPATCASIYLDCNSMVKAAQFSAVDGLTGYTSISNCMVLPLFFFSNLCSQSNQFNMLLLPLAKMPRKNHNCWFTVCTRVQNCLHW